MNIKLMALVALAATAIATPALATDATGSITVIRPLTVTKNADLDFGTVIRPDSGSGTVTVATDSARSVANGVVALSSTTASAAGFTINGEGGQSVSVTIPASFTLSSGSNSLSVTTSSDLANPALVSGLKPGVAVALEFVERQPGEWVITSLKPQAAHAH